MNPLTFLGSGSLLSHSYQRCPLSSTALDLKRDVPRASSFFWPKAFIELEWGGTPGQPDHPEGPRGCDTSPVRGQGPAPCALQGKSLSTGDRIDGDKQAEGEMIQISRKCRWGEPLLR